MSKQIEVIISPGGEVRHLIDEENAELYVPFGAVTGGYRNSHVDMTCDLLDKAVGWLMANSADRFIHGKHAYYVRDALPQNVWWADMLPVGGPVLGPFDTRKEALAREIEWLQQHNLPRPL